MDFSILQTIYIFIASFIGEVMGSMFGGGSFFIQPALLAAGIPANFAIANDVAAALFSNLAFLAFYKSEGNILKRSCYLKIMVTMLPGLIGGAVLGGYLLAVIPTTFMKISIISICSLGLVYKIYEMFFRKIKLDENAKRSSFIPYWIIFSMLGGLGLGLYDGLSGAGSGIIYILLITTLFGISMKETFYVANLLSAVSLGIAGLTTLLMGLIKPELMIIMVPACFIGGYVGAKAAMYLPEELFKRLYIGLLAALLLYILLN